MGVLGPGIDLQLSSHLLAERILGQHSLDRSGEQFRRPPRMKMLGGDGLEAAGVSGVMDIRLRFELRSGERDLWRVANDHMSARFSVRWDVRLLCTPQS